MELDKLDSTEIAVVDTKNFINSTIQARAKETSNVKDAIDLATTQQAISKDETVNKLIEEKTDELVNDAIRKRVEAETEKINKEVEKVKAEADKKIAEYETSIAAKKKEYEELEAQDKKEQAYFDNHKSILRCIGIREKLSLKVMQGWLYPASAVYFIFQFLLLPLTMISFVIEQLINIVDTISEKFKKTGWKIAISILAVIVICVLLFGAYYGGTYAISHWFK